MADEPVISERNRMELKLVIAVIVGVVTAGGIITDVKMGQAANKAGIEENRRQIAKVEARLAAIGDKEATDAKIEAMKEYMTEEMRRVRDRLDKSLDAQPRR